MTTAFARRKARLRAIACARQSMNAGGDGPYGEATAARGSLTLGLWAVLTCQFMGAFNDHFFKMLVSLATISAGQDGGGASSAYLSLSGAIYVLPFLLFSGLAGSLADRFDKRRVIIAIKGAEVVLAGLAVAAMLTGSIAFLLAVLFLFAAQSAFFSPPKYGILPEIVPPAALPRANGVVEFSRYVAIISGTAVAGILASLWGRGALGLGVVIVAFAVAGWAVSFAVPSAASHGSGGAAPRRAAGASRGGIRTVLATPRLRLLVLLTTGLDFAMTLISLVVLLLAKNTMALSDLRSGLLVTMAGIGVATGSMLAGYLSRGRAEMGFVPLGAAGASAGLILLSNSATFTLALVSLGIMGVSTGFMVVPLYTGLQRTASPSERGRVIGANNFFNMFGVLLGSGLLWVLHDVVGLGPDRILAALALTILTLAVTALGRSARLRGRVSLLAASALEGLRQVSECGMVRMRHVPAVVRARLGMGRN